MSEAQQLNALCDRLPPETAVQLRSWALQAHMARLLHPRLRDGAAPAASQNAITVQIFWWGFHFVIPEPVMVAFEKSSPTPASFAAGITGHVAPVAPFAMLAGAYVATELELMKAVDRGRGVFLNMAWLAPGVFVSTAI
jgi:hypothetical protein